MKFMKSTNGALFITGAIMVVILVLLEKFFGLISGTNMLFAGVPVDPMLSLLTVMGAAVVIMMTLFSVMLSRKMKLKLK
jgi:membrane protein implicated in regulation of membrane protease activity